MKKTFWLLAVLVAVPLFAVTPSFWEVHTYDDFQRGKLTNLSLTSDDQLRLAPRFDAVFDTEQPFVWSSVADSKGNVYLGTGHDGKIYRVDAAGKGQMIADLAELDVFALAVDARDVLYAGTSPNGKVYRIENGGQPSVFFDPKSRYIWSMVFDKQGRLLVGTGDQGVIYRVTPDGKGETFYDTDETHVISLAVDLDGNVIAGGDPKGYLYRISPAGKAFVLYDSGMREVHAVAAAADGRIFAAVLSGPAGSLPSSISPAGGDPALGSPSQDITVTIGSARNSAQNVDVAIEPDPTPDVPAASGRRPSANGSMQSVILEVLPNGTVNTLYRLRDEMVYSLLPRGDKLLFSTGTKGRIYSIDSARNTTLILESSEEQTTRLLGVGNRVLAASANMGKLFSLSDSPATSGKYESTVRDTEAVSSWGKVSWRADNPQLIQILTRSGNTSAPDKTWSEWAAIDGAGTVSSPNARFMQWQAVLKSDATRSPALNSVTVPYLQQNFAPEITAVEVLPSGVSLAKVFPLNASGNPVISQDPATTRANTRAGLPPLPKLPPRRAVQKGAQSFQWTASDRNQDVLRYDVYYREVSERTWIPLKKDLEDSFYTINPDTLPDGNYVLRIVASDGPSNPPSGELTAAMESHQFSIDSTPPVVTVRQEALTGGRAIVAIEAADSTSTLNQAEVSVDSGEWRTLFPKDGITDSRAESFAYQSDVLARGEHVLAFRIYDQSDNVGVGKLIVRIP